MKEYLVIFLYIINLMIYLSLADAFKSLMVTCWRKKG